MFMTYVWAFFCQNTKNGICGQGTEACTQAPTPHPSAYYPTHSVNPKPSLYREKKSEAAVAYTCFSLKASRTPWVIKRSLLRPVIVQKVLLLFKKIQERRKGTKSTWQHEPGYWVGLGLQIDSNKCLNMPGDVFKMANILRTMSRH